MMRSGCSDDGEATGMEVGGGLCGTDGDAEVAVMGDGQRWL
jgi:hypothetical protein